MNTRAVAARALASVIQQHSSLDTAIERASHDVDEKYQPLLREMCFGACRYYFSLEAALARLLKKPLKAKDGDIKALILLGFYQLLFMRVPDHAAINETVNGTKSLKKIWAKNLVNGVLRQFSRERDMFANAVSEHHNHPDWLYRKILAAWPNQAQDIFSHNNQQAPLTIRVNQRLHTQKAYAAALKTKGYETTACTYARQGLQLLKPCNVKELPDFSTGACSVQDEAAQLSAELLNLAPGQRVLDACCAPGGKTCHIAEQEPALAALIAVDQERSRLKRVEENLLRLHLDATVLCAEAQNLNDWWDQQLFDRILLDAPCSATGVIRRHPDIKLLRRTSDIHQLTRLQTELLTTLWTTLRPGGLLLYATCSVLPEENELQVKSFVERQGDAIHLSIDASWGEARPFGRQLMPQKNTHDGFYYALLQKGV